MHWTTFLFEKKGKEKNVKQNRLRQIFSLQEYIQHHSLSCFYSGAKKRETNLIHFLPYALCSVYNRGEASFCPFLNKKNTTLSQRTNSATYIEPPACMTVNSSC